MRDKDHIGRQLVIESDGETFDFFKSNFEPSNAST